MTVFVGLVDPYHIYGVLHAERFNATKYKVEAYERLSKIYQVRRFQPEAIILGSSVTDVGLRPDTLSKLAGKAFNLSFAGGGIREVNMAFQFAVAHTPVKTAVVGLEPFGFGAADAAHVTALSHRVLGSQWSTFKDLARHTLSLNGFYDSVYTIFANLRGYPTTHSADGLYTGYLPYALPDTPREPAVLDFSEAAYDAFAQMCRVAREKGIDLRLFVSPLHHTYVVRDTERAAWVDRLDAIAQEFGFTIRRYETFNLDTRNDAFYLDGTHFRPESGDLILRALFAGDKDAPVEASDRR